MAVLLAAIAAPAAAQQLVPTGVRVRVRLWEQERQIETRFGRGMILRGKVTAQNADTIWMRPTPLTGEVAVPTSAIRTLWQSRGVPSRFGSFVIEGVAGMFLGALEAYLLTESSSIAFGAPTLGRAMAWGAGGGLVIFGLMGAIWPAEYWRRVPLHR